LSQEFDVVVLDLSNSWGIATFVALSLCQRIMLVMDDHPVSVEQTLYCSERIIRESNNDQLLGIKNWHIVINKYTSSLVTISNLQLRLEQIDLFPPSRGLHYVPYSKHLASSKAKSKQTLYQSSDKRLIAKLQDLAFAGATFVRKRPRSLWRGRLT
jgi:cellulose biosynthesis protein BcsQ